MVPGVVPRVPHCCWLIPSGRHVSPERLGSAHAHRVFPEVIFLAWQGLPYVSGFATNVELIHFWRGSLRIYVRGV